MRVTSRAIGALASTDVNIFADIESAQKLEGNSYLEVSFHVCGPMLVPQSAGKGKLRSNVSVYSLPK